MKNAPIGILDSGLGGLTIWKEIHSLLPHESTIYLGDSLHTPYGQRSSEEIHQLAKKLVAFLLGKGVKVIVIACNTITVSSLERLRQEFPHVSFIGTVPVVKTAVATTRNKRIGILSTTHTAKSQYQKALIDSFAGECVVVNEGTDALVPLVERGELTGEKMEALLGNVLDVFQKEQCDTLVLGCTHFPFLKRQMQQILGSKVTILDSASAIAQQVRRVLASEHTISTEKEGVSQFYTTGDNRLANKLLQATITRGSDTEIGHFETITL